MPRFKVVGKGEQGRPPSNAPAQTAASSSGPPPPPSNGPKIMAASSATQTPKPEHFDLTIDDDMQDAQDGTRKVLAEQEQATLERKIAIAQQIANHLGPQSSTADQSYVARLTELGRAGRRQLRSRSKIPMEVSKDEQQPPPPPPPGATPIIISGGKAPKAIRIRLKPKTIPQPPPRRGRSQNPNEAMAIEPGPPPPGPPPPPAGMSGPGVLKGVRSKKVKPVVVRRARSRARSEKVEPTAAKM